MIVSRQRGSLRWNGFPIFEAPDHMLARMMQRAPGIDAAAALYQGAQSFLGADREMIAAQPRETLYIPTGPGLSVGLPIRALSPDRKAHLILRGQTWLADRMAGPDQARLRRRLTRRGACWRRRWRVGDEGKPVMTDAEFRGHLDKLYAEEARRFGPMLDAMLLEAQSLRLVEGHRARERTLHSEDTDRVSLNHSPEEE